MKFIFLTQYMMMGMLVLASADSTSNDSRKLRGKHHRVSSQHKTGKNHHGRMPRAGLHPVFNKHHKEKRHLPTHFTTTTHFHRAHKTTHGKKKEHHEFTSRIVGGEDTNAGEFKFMVSWDGDCGK